MWREPDGLKLGDTGGYSRRDRAEVCVADELKITAGPFTFVGRLETKLAPTTCAAFVRSLPFRSRLVHVRWSGEAV